MRGITLTVGGTPVGTAKTWAYPNGSALGKFLIPFYKLSVLGAGNDGTSIAQIFSVLRFGILCKDGKTAGVVGLANYQSYIIKAWLPNYTVHSARSPENGAWQVLDDFLIHDGPDNDTELFATIGCIEIMGPQGFVKFNDLLISLMNPPGKDREEKLATIGRSGRLKIIYEKAVRPALKKAA